MFFCIYFGSRAAPWPRFRSERDEVLVVAQPLPNSALHRYFNGLRLNWGVGASRVHQFTENAINEPLRPVRGRAPSARGGLNLLLG